MKRTISEVIDLIKQKKESAEKEHEQLYVSFISKDMPSEEQARYSRLCGNDEAYIDVLSLLESSHLIEQEKAIEILKRKLNFDYSDPTNEVWIDDKSKHYLVIEVKEDEKKILSEVLCKKD